jgi:hypothetical protein
VAASAEKGDGTATPLRTVVDSALPADEELRRFRASLPHVSMLEGAATSRDALVHEFVSALEHNDTTALIRLHVTRAEWAWLVYPFSVQAHPPYHQPPEIAWMLATAASTKGLTRLMKRRAGRSLDVVGYRCNKQPSREGENRIWRGCELRIDARASNEPTRQRLFGAIIERAGRFKFLSYANQF